MSRGRPPSFDYESYDDLVGLGYTADEIATRFGIHRASLDRAISRRAAKITDPPPSGTRRDR